MTGSEKYLEYATRCLAYADETDGNERQFWLKAADRFQRGARMIERSQTLLIESRQLLAAINEVNRRTANAPVTVAEAAAGSQLAAFISMDFVFCDRPHGRPANTWSRLGRLESAGGRSVAFSCKYPGIVATGVRPPSAELNR